MATKKIFFFDNEKLTVAGWLNFIIVVFFQVPSVEGDGSAAALTGSTASGKKVKGQARRERRSKTAASGGLDEGEEGGGATGNSVGAYVHISRISDERVEHVERSYKPGQKVRVLLHVSGLRRYFAAF